MIRRSLSILIGVCLSLISLAQEKQGHVLLETQVDSLEKALLWRIDGDSLKNPSYLYGTIHMIPEKDYFLSDSTKAAFERSEKVVFEVNLEEMMDFSAQLELMMGAMMTDGTTLKDLLNEDEYRLVKNHFESMGLPMIFMDRIKPMFLTVMSGGGDMGNPFGGEGEENMVSYEMKLWEMSEEREIDGLETAAFQMSVFDSIPYEKQAEMLVESLNTDSTANAMMDMDFMVELYKSQDIHSMNLLLGEDESLEGFENLLLNDRNQRWIAKIESMMRAQICFFAVGAGHLGGEEGVVNLLRQLGYKLTPIP